MASQMSQCQEKRLSELILNQIIQFKWITMGKSTVGKTSLVQRFIQNQFNAFNPTTIGAHITTKTIHINGKTIKIECNFSYFTGTSFVLIFYFSTLVFASIFCWHSLGHGGWRTVLIWNKFTTPIEKCKCLAIEYDKFILISFQSLVPLYFRGAHAAFIVYDIRCSTSFHMAKMSVEKLRKEVSITFNSWNDPVIHNEILTLNHIFLD